MIAEKLYGTGGIIQERDETIAGFGELVADSPVFDWERGFDIRKKLGRELSTKNQGQSGSCGGQASSYLTEAILNSAETSARSIYNKCFVKPAGSSESGLINTILNIGVDKESDTTSYENGNPPSEDFMQTPDGNPSFIRGLRPVYVDTNFNSMATAALQNNGIIIGISGQNNGTWLSPEPKPPVNSNDWRHWVYVGFAGMRNGKKCIGFKNSWGKDVGENGWQYIYEDYEPYLFCAWSMVYNTKNRPVYNFTKSLAFGQSSSDIKALQDILRFEGLFNNVSTGYYGPVTAVAVLAFQKKYKVSNDKELDALHGKKVGPLTLQKLNELYN